MFKTFGTAARAAGVVMSLLLTGLLFGCDSQPSAGTNGGSPAASPQAPTVEDIVIEPYDKPADEAAVKPYDKPSDKPSDKPADKPADKPKNDGEPLAIVDAAPDFEALLLTGDTVKLSDFKGKVVLVNFWATWCGPCVGEMPDIQRIADEYPDDVVVIGVNCGEEEALVRGHIEKNGFTYNIALDEDMVIGDLYPTDGIPYTLIIDRDGVISNILIGASDDMYSVFDEKINKVL